jgi:hypothetical protein
MNIILFLVVQAICLTTIFWIIPTYAPPDEAEMIKDWTGLGFSALLLLTALIESRFSDPTIGIPIGFYLVVLALCLSGVYWWIPTYVAKPQQKNATMWLFLSTTLSTILTNSLSASTRPMLGGRRR